MSGGMFPKVQSAVSNRGVYIPSGGTWWCYGFDNNDELLNESIAGGTRIDASCGSFLPSQIMCIKIA